MNNFLSPTEDRLKIVWIPIRDYTPPSIEQVKQFIHLVLETKTAGKVKWHAIELYLELIVQVSQSLHHKGCNRSLGCACHVMSCQVI